MRFFANVQAYKDFKVTCAYKSGLDPLPADLAAFSLLLFLVTSNKGFSETESAYDLFVDLRGVYLEGDDNGSLTTSRKSSRSSRRLRREIGSTGNWTVQGCIREGEAQYQA